jgi:ComF family protein
MKAFWQKAYSQLLGSFLQTPCPLCERSAKAVICPDCEQQIKSCQLPSPYHPEVSEVPIFAWGAYLGSLKRAIQLMKYQNKPDLAYQLGIQLGQLWLQQGQDFLSSSSRLLKGAAAVQQSLRPVIVPVPLYAERLQQRGYNQAALIAQGFCQITGLPCLERGLLRVRGTDAQYKLGLQGRQQNLAGAFRLGPDWTLDRLASPVLLIDDIYTTGATALSAATELRCSGIRVLGMIAVARAILGHPGKAWAGEGQRLQHQKLKPDLVR